jgi:hypothetical protein
MGMRLLGNVLKPGYDALGINITSGVNTVQDQGIFTLPQQVAASSTQKWTNDFAFDQTILLLQADNAANATQNNSFVDSSPSPFTITRAGESTQGTFTPFSLPQGYWSVGFIDSASTDRLDITVTGQAPGTGSFTYECFFYLNDLLSQASLFNTRGGGTGGDGFDVAVLADGSISVTTSGSPLLTTALNVVSPGRWYHLAVVRNGSTNWTVYLNGISVGTISNALNCTSTNVYIGYTGLYLYLNGYISNFRYTRNALYTSRFNPPTTPLTTTSQGATASEVELLTCQDNIFRDNSSNGFTVAPQSTNLTIEAFSPFTPPRQWNATEVGGSVFLDASGDYLTGNGPFQTSASMSTFTIEGWIYPTSFANRIYLIGDMNPTAATDYISVDISTGGNVILYWYDGNARSCTSTGVMRVKQWNWFSVVVNSNAISIYVNSTTAGQTGTTTLTARTGSMNFAVGTFGSAATPNAYISSLRVSTVARTVSEIPSAPYTSDANTRILLNFTNANIRDNSMKMDLITADNAQINTRIIKYGTGSLYFDGTNDRILNLSEPIMALGNADFTVEFWFYWIGGTTFSIIDTRSPDTANLGFDFYIGSNKINWGTATTNYCVGTTVLRTYRWYHVAGVRFGSNMRLYLNGLQEGSTFTAGTAQNFTNKALRIGFGANGSFTGYLDEIRITKGLARYLNTFVPPTTSFPRQ